MVSFTVCLFVTIGAMALMERLAKPQAVNWRLLPRFSLLSAMPAVVFYMTMFMISYRPLFAMGAALITFGAIIIVNNAKFAALKEPLVFSDFALLRQAIAHPALYARYIGRGNIALVVVAAILAIYAATAYEEPLIQRSSINDFFPTALFLFVTLGMIYSVTQGPFRGTFLQLLRRFGPEADIRHDVEKLSLVVCLIFYFLLANETVAPPAQPGTKAMKPPPPLRWQGAAGELPSVVVVQNESFFDVRRIHPSIPRGVLARWDALGASAAYRGQLIVPAWGANTMRTEFAFLSGLPSEALGVHRFNPYLNLCKMPVWTIAHQLRAMGYRTVCLHPYSSSFFDRDRAFPNLGFDLFLDIEAFAGAATFGPYVSDRAVADKIIDALGEHPGPQFIFAITMENHGRWEPGRLDGETAPRLALPETPLGSRELGLYLRHVANADAMAGRVVDFLYEQKGDAVFCMFGDHVPSLPIVFDEAAYTDARTDYLVWKKSGRQPRVLNVSADVLGRLVLDAVLNEANHAVAQPQSRFAR